MKPVFYITGRGGSLNKGLALHLQSRTKQFDGIAVDVDFLRMQPLMQVETIQRALKSDPDRLIIANSYGAYLTLQALIDLDITPEKLLLLSPVLGVAKANDRMYLSRPPLTKRLKAALKNKTIAKPKKVKIIMGDMDKLYDSDTLTLFDSYFGGKVVNILSGEGHMITEEAVQNALESFT